MFHRSLGKQVNRLTRPIIAAGLLFGVVAVPLTWARVMGNTIDPVAVGTEGGRHVVVTGPITCTSGERAYLSVTLTQRTTGATAEGTTLVTCTEVNEPWTVDAVVKGKQGFEPGTAVAVAVATTVQRGTTSDAHQWLVNVTIVPE